MLNTSTSTPFSYLKTLMEPFNEVVDKFLDKLKPLADGATAVPMKTKFSELTLKVISKVATYTLIMECLNGFA